MKDLTELREMIDQLDVESPTATAIDRILTILDHLVQNMERIELRCPYTAVGCPVESKKD